MTRTSNIARGISAWHAPDDGRPWYAASWLTPEAHRGRDVRLMVGASQIIGRIGVHKGSRRWAWLEFLPALNDHVLLAPWRIIGPRDLPTQREPTAFQLFDDDSVERWPGLPEPMLSHAAKPTPPPAAAVYEDFSECEGWPYPGLTLGHRVPPLSVEETEARVLRGMRTEHAQSRVGVARPTHSADIPREFYFLMKRRQLADEIAARRERRELDTDLHPVRIAWWPSRRDEGDWDYAVAWMQTLSQQVRRIVEARGANPPLSWRQIERQVGVNETTARRLYKRAMADMMAFAGCQPQKTAAAAQQAKQGKAA